MPTKKVTATQSARTGSYTIRVSKSAITGRFVSTPKKSGQIVVSESTKKGK